ncbi:hypothetical protein [Lacticaseibacillus suihuaensis]
MAISIDGNTVTLPDTNVLEFTMFETPPSSEWQLYADGGTGWSLYVRRAFLDYSEIVGRSGVSWPRDVLINSAEHWLQPCLNIPQGAVPINHGQLFIASNRTNVKNNDEVTAVQLTAPNQLYQQVSELPAKIYGPSQTFLEPIIGSFFVGEVFQRGGELYLSYDLPDQIESLKNRIRLRPLGPLFLGRTPQVVAEEGLYDIDVAHWRLILTETRDDD